MSTPEDTSARLQSIFDRLRLESTPDGESDQQTFEDESAVITDDAMRADDDDAGPEEPVMEGETSEAEGSGDTEPAVVAETETPATEAWSVPSVEESTVDDAVSDVESADEATTARSIDEIESDVALEEASADVAPPEAETVAPAPVPRRALPRILAVANQKGGVGKTTTAVNLSAALAELGYRVLVVDLDPQGNATTGLGVNARSLDATVYDVLMRDLPLEDAIEATNVRNLFVVPATIDLAGAEIELVPAFSRELKLKRALESVGDDFDYTLIDCPPSLGLLTVNALAAAGEVVVPIQCEYYALEGLSQLMRNVQLVRGNLNPTLELSTIILTMYDSRTKLAEQVANEVREHFGPIVCRHRVPRSVRLSEAPSFGQPITTFDPTSRGAIAYRELAKEVSGGAPQRIG
jgi:chromosome partitioning protein